MVALSSKYQTQGLVVLGLNGWDEAEKAVAYAKENITYPALLGMDETFKAYGVRGIPTTFFVDRKGIVRFRQVGFGSGVEKDMEAQIGQLLGESPAP